MDCVDQVELTVGEFQELVDVAHHTFMVRRGLKTDDDRLWRAVVLNVLSWRKEQAMRRLARDLQDPDSAASKLRDNLLEIERGDAARSYSALAWIEDGRVRCCSSLCCLEETCDQREAHGCRPVRVVEEEVACRG